MRKRLLAIVGAIVLVLAVAVAAYGSGTPSDNMVHACYKTSGPGQGALIRIDQAASCPGGFTPLNWPARALGYDVFTVNGQFFVPADGQQHQYTLDCGGGPIVALSSDGQVWVSDAVSGEHFLPVLTMKANHFFVVDGDQPGGLIRTLDAELTCAHQLV
jgi:hypothetical protein